MKPANISTVPLLSLWCCSSGFESQVGTFIFSLFNVKTKSQFGDLKLKSKQILKNCGPRTKYYEEEKWVWSLGSSAVRAGRLRIFLSLYFWRWRIWVGEGREAGSVLTADGAPPGHTVPSPAFLLSHLPEMPSRITAQKTGQGHTEIWIFSDLWSFLHFPSSFSICSQDLEHGGCKDYLILWQKGAICLFKRWMVDGYHVNLSCIIDNTAQLWQMYT